jgi:HNH endonuclease
MTNIKCECGCGLLPRAGRRFRKGHNKRGKQSPWWKGGRIISSDGYVLIWCPDHKRAQHGYVPEHILVMEKALGRPIETTEAVHHIDQNRANNYVGNLMVFKTHAQHLAYHKRLIVFEVCGHYDWRYCPFCERYDAVEKLKSYGKGFFHEPCRKAYYQKYHKERAAA